MAVMTCTKRTANRSKRQLAGHIVHGVALSDVFLGVCGSVPLERLDHRPRPSSVLILGQFFRAEAVQHKTTERRKAIPLAQQNSWPCEADCVAPHPPTATRSRSRSRWRRSPFAAVFQFHIRQQSRCPPPRPMPNITMTPPPTPSIGIGNGSRRPPWGRAHRHQGKRRW